MGNKTLLEFYMPRINTHSLHSATASSLLTTPPDTGASRNMSPAEPVGADQEPASHAALIHRQVQLYQALSEINQAIVRMTSEAELFPLVCETAVRFGGVSMAWIGVADYDSGVLVPQESYGQDTDYLDTFRASIGPDPAESQWPSTRAYRSGRPVIVNDWSHTPASEPQTESAGCFQWGSGASFAVPRQGRPFAVLSVYHKERDFFDSETTRLLEEIARDISFALDNFDREKQRLDAVEGLRASEQRFRAYFEQSMFGMAAIAPDGSWIEVNKALCDMFGYPEAELVTLKWPQLTHQDDRATGYTLFSQLLDGSVNDFVIEKRYIRKDRNIIDGMLAARAVRHDDGRLAYVVVLVEDITRRKMAERREQMRQKTLELVARGKSLEEVMMQVICSAEAIYPGSMCSILLLDETGQHLHSGAAPDLPEFFNRAIDGVRIGPGVGSCGTAAFTGRRTIVDNIATHPYWKDFREVALDAGLESCWSEPIRSTSGRVLGTFAIYRAQPGTPDEQEISLIESAANLMGIAIDRDRAEEELHLAASIYNNSSEAVLVTDAANTIVAINPAFTRITGYTLEEVRGKDPSILHSGRHDSGFFRAMWKDIGEHGFWQGEIWNRRKNGETFPEWLTINVICNDRDEVQRYVAIGSDITNKIRSDELIWRQANYDFLTGLPNRYMFQDRLEQEIRKSKREKLQLALLFIDLDHFKDVNDTLGHPIGDQLLIRTAERLIGAVRASDTVARMGGDEFTVIVRDLQTPTDAEQVASHIITALAAPYTINNETIYAPASVGITFYPDDATDVDQLISNADQAMYASKIAGRNRASYFTRALQDSAHKRLSLITDLRVAGINNQFELHYQPIINLANGRVIKAEVLIRWNHPERGIISPTEFIPLAEETGLIVGIGDWVFRQAVATARDWFDRLGTELQISVNVSPVQFQNGLNIRSWLQHLKAVGLNERYVSIEITEGLLLNASKEVKDKLMQFRDAGIQLAIDDFGVGYSALSYLRRFDIDYLKIDQSFVRNLETIQNDLVLSEAIVVMAHKLGLKVTAEGVETEAQRRLLVDIGCDHGQGFLFSPPLPAREFETYLRAQHNRA